jgi:formylmethanofuran:tetrahydromethanopterin formyltransferase
MRKMIFNTAVAVGMVSAVAGAWFYNAGQTEATVFTPAEASIAALSPYDLTVLHGKDLPVENWEPAY